MLNLSGGVVTSGKEWTDDGEVHEVHSLKRRAASATRPVPVPPLVVAPIGIALPCGCSPGPRDLSANEAHSSAGHD